MALFRIFKGNSANLPVEMHDGYCYFTTDDGKFYIDYLSDPTDSTSLARRAINGSCIEFIQGTQTAATNAWTGRTKDPALYTGKMIAYLLPETCSSNNAITLQLTFPNNTTTAAITVKGAFNSNASARYISDIVLFLCYDGTYWKVMSENLVVQKTAGSGYTYWRPLLAGHYSSSGLNNFSPSNVQEAVYAVTTIAIQPSTGTIHAPVFQGELDGNADTATKADITSTANSLAYYSDTAGTFASASDLLWDSTNELLTDGSGDSPNVPTMPMSSNDTHIATTAFVHNAFALNDAMLFKGTIGNTASPTNATIASLPTNGYQAGWTYRVVTAGTYTTGTYCEIGDLIIAVHDGPTSADAQTVIGDDWTIAQTNVDGAVYMGHGNSAIGSLTQPVYVQSSGLVAPTTHSLNATINAGTANKVAYYSDANTISANTPAWEAWTPGTTAGPQANIQIGNTTYQSAAIPAAGDGASGIVTTGAQQFNGDKTFKGDVLPESDDSYELGSSSDAWKVLYLDSSSTSASDSGHGINIDSAHIGVDSTDDTLLISSLGNAELHGEEVNIQSNSGEDINLISGEDIHASAVNEIILQPDSANSDNTGPVILNATALYPDAEDKDLGTATDAWDNAYINNIILNGVTPNRVMWTDENNVIQAANHYADTSHMAVNVVSNETNNANSNSPWEGPPEENFLVEGNTRLHGTVAEGDQTQALGDYAHAEGHLTQALGYYSHAEGAGWGTVSFYILDYDSANDVYTSDMDLSGSYYAINNEQYIIVNNQINIINDAYYDENDDSYKFSVVNSFSPALVIDPNEPLEAQMIIPGGVSLGDYSHSEGEDTTAAARASHTEGSYTTASNYAAHAEGMATVASGQDAHAEGYYTLASGDESHAEGYQTIASNYSAHAEGDSTRAFGDSSHAEGFGRIINFNIEISTEEYIDENDQTITTNGYAVTTSGITMSSYLNKLLYIEANNQVVEITYVNGTFFTTSPAIANGYEGRVQILGGVAYTNGDHAEGYNTIAGSNKGINTSGSDDSDMGAHAEGHSTIATGTYGSHAEGYGSKSLGKASHSEGDGTIASGQASHSEGYGTKAGGKASHAEGSGTTASGDYSHAEGYQALASNLYAHAEGNQTVASGSTSHAEGGYAQALGTLAHAEGYYTLAASRAQHVFGYYNIADENTAGTGNTHDPTKKGTYVEIVGGGTSTSNRKNIRTLTWSGDEAIAGHFIPMVNGNKTIGSINYGNANPADPRTWQALYLNGNNGNQNCIDYDLTFGNDITGSLGHLGLNTQSNGMGIHTTGTFGITPQCTFNTTHRTIEGSAGYSFTSTELYPSGTTNTQSLGTTSKIWKDIYTYSVSARHLDAAPTNVHTDSSLYIGWGSIQPTKATKIYYSADTSSRTEFFEVNSNGAYALTRFGVNGQNTSYNFYVNGTSYFADDITSNKTIYFGNNTSVAAGKPILAYNASNPAYGITYYEGNPDVMTFSATGNANSKTGADFAINGLGNGILSHLGNYIPHTGNTTGTVGTATKPVYVNAGTITAGSWELKATVNNGTATRIAYYSGDNAISSGSIVTDGSYLRNVGGYNNTSYALSTASFICNSWVRTVGSTGWYNETYSGGWYMNEATWIRSYNNKRVLIQTAAGADTDSLRIQTSATPAANACMWASASLAGNMVANSKYVHIIGKAASTGNSGYIGYFWNAANGANNYVTIGHYGVNDIVKVYKDQRVTVGNSTSTGSFGISNATNSTGNGISLYGGAQIGMPQYGIAFAGTGTFGTFGGVTESWATYFTTSNTSNRGWIFKRYVATDANTKKAYNSAAIRCQDGIYFGGGISLYHPNFPSAWYGDFYINKLGTANSGDNNATQGTLGEVYLRVGNNVARPAAGTAGGANNARGRIWLYNDGAGYAEMLGAQGKLDGTNNRNYVAVGYLKGTQLWAAVWNDYAEFRATKEDIEPGRCIVEIGDDTLELSTKRLQRGCEIVSDTYGFAIGQTEECKTPVAASGRVLAYGYESREEFASHIGWPVCSGPDGTVSIMTEEEEEKYPSRIIGTISAVPSYEEWGEDNVKVNGRVWIRIR